MSRSYRKHPKGRGWDSHFSDKEWKQSYNRKTRRKVNTMIASVHQDEIDELNFPSRSFEYDDNWCSKADGGSRYFGHYNSVRIEYSPWMTIDHDNSYEYGLYNNKDVYNICQQFTICDYIIEKMIYSIKEYGQYHYRRYTYKVRQTKEDEIKEYQALYKKRMRK